ncbi:hypothetical protein F5141DRAFT_1288791 [Pisolithus sp. B1]|nr:hypothetical protein F5141DRAFT_1288791 [Pisolithus sp. B1]
MRIIGIDPEDSAYHPVVSHVSGDTWLKLHMRIQADVATVYHTTSRRRLALHRAKGISLPTNERFVLLLKACSTRLAGKHLVTTLIQCSDFYRLDEDGNRRDSGHDFTPESDLYAPETGIFSPFCAIASPQVWRREPPCVRRREQFRSIREHFYALVNIIFRWVFHLPTVLIEFLQYRPTGTQWSHRFSNKRKEVRAVRFFLGLFGLTYLRSYVEEGLLPHTPILSCTDWVTRYTPLRGSQQSNAVQSNARHEVVLPLLHRRCQILRARRDVPRRYAAEKQKVECELKSILRTLGVGM